MADSYTEFSTAIDSITSEEAEWLEEQLVVVPSDDGGDTLKLFEDESPEYTEMFSGVLELDWEIKGRDDVDCYLWLYSEDHGDPWLASEIIHRFFGRFRPQDSHVLEYACTCNKPRIDEFGGGKLGITAKGVYEVDMSWPAIQERDGVTIGSSSPAVHPGVSAGVLAAREQLQAGDNPAEVLADLIACLGYWFSFPEEE